MSYRLDDDLLKTLLKHYGPRCQCLKSLEEAGEYVQILSKLRCHEESGHVDMSIRRELIACLVEEMSDTIFTMRQVALHYGITGEVERKLKTLEDLWRRKAKQEAWH